MKRNRLFSRAALAAAAGLFVLLPLAGNAQVAIDETNFPDELFRAYVLENFDTDQDGSLSDAEREAVTSIDVYRESSLTSLQGLEYFPSLEILECSETGLTSLDVSRNPALRELYCNFTDLTSLDVSGLPALEILKCTVTGITSLDVSGNPALEALNCGSTGLTSLDVSQNPGLKELDCTATGLTSLDVSGNLALWYLVASYTGITSLYLSGHPALEYLYCDNTGITSLDVSGAPALKYLHCEYTALTSLDVSRNPALQELYCLHSGLSHIDLSQNPALEGVALEGNIHPVDAEVGGTCDLSRIPGFDLSRVSWEPGTEIEGSLLRFTTETVRYEYDTRLGGEEYKAEFALQAVPGLGNEPGAPESAAAAPQPFRAHAEDGVLHVENARGLVEVFNLQGRRLYAGQESRIPLPSQGVYIVRNQGRSLKVANL